MTRSAAQVRQEFIDFFRARGHAFVPSSPVVPHADPTLLFTNAGMNQFKPYFLGAERPPHARVANTQKCIRAGGKHNDLDDVGHDTYHHTFFEMLGNWSFGDYFKREAIGWAWELLTKVWGLEPSRLHATYFGGDESEGLEPDFEARDLWAGVTDIDRTHIHAGNKKDNFWEMGETGPCGPCSEIHIDLTPDTSGGPLVNAGDPRVIEIWNLVFIQFNRGADGRLAPLPARHVDTGMGFERVTAVLQGHNNNYATDVFVPIIQAIEGISGYAYGRDGGTEGGRDEGEGSRDPGIQGSRGNSAVAAPVSTFPPSHLPTAGRYARFVPGDMRDEACRVIADHVRCLTFAITDGAVPDREGRGYVLRRILRRAVRYGWQYLNIHEPFLHRLVPTVVATMGDAFPELRRDPARVAETIREEEESFDRTLERGIALFEEAAEYARTQHHGEIRGQDAFRLHDTYGFPIDLTQVMAQEKGLTVDIGEYERLMEEARALARAGGRADAPDLSAIGAELATQLGGTDDSPKYTTSELETLAPQILRFRPDGRVELIEAEDALLQGESGALVLTKTCFYAEQGGQIGDRGLIRTDRDPEESRDWFTVEDTVRAGDAILHVGTVRRGAFGLGEPVFIQVHERRALTMKNHTATHVLNWALREVLGEHVQQKGSLVDHEKTRFDFSHPRAMTPEEILRVEDLVNQKIAAQLPVNWQVVPKERALQIEGLRAVFGEHYPDEVRVLSVGVPVEDLLREPQNPRWREVSIEFCGGTHVHNTAEIEQFALVSEEAVAKGIRRVVGLTGPAARAAQQRGADLLHRAGTLAAGRVPAGLAELQAELAAAVIPIRHRLALRDRLAELQQIVRQQHKAEAADAADVVQERVTELLKNVERIGPTAVVVAEMPDVPVEQLKSGADRIKQKCGSAVVLFGVHQGGSGPGTRDSGFGVQGSGLEPERAEPPDADRALDPNRDREGAAFDPNRDRAGAAFDPNRDRDPRRDRAGAVPQPAPAGKKAESGKALLLAAVTDDLVKKGLKAGDLVKAIAPLVRGGGGGPPTMAQAGGKDPARLPEALAAGRQWIEDRLA